MTESLARRERAALCALALQVGADAPTLCAGWDARDLVVHLLVRERRPLSAVGIVVPALSRLTDHAAAAYDGTGLDELVERLSHPGPLVALAPVDRVANTIEMLVHHEDLRRGRPGWEPRTLPAQDVETVWRMLRRTARLTGRTLAHPTVLRRADSGEEVVARGGADPQIVTGEVVELLLHLFGRSETRVRID